VFTWFGFGVVAACGVVLLIANIVNDRDDPNALAGGMNAFIWIVSFVVYLFAAGIYTQSAIRPFEITEDDITLGKVSPDFVEALEDDRDRYEEERRERRRRDRDADRDERDD
jgi:hypothetical protein